jgi:hypothetical protein
MKDFIEIYTVWFVKVITKFLVLKGVTEMSFLVLKRISENSEEDQYFILPNCSLVIELQFGNIEYKFSSEFTLTLFKTKNDISVTPFRTKNGGLLLRIRRYKILKIKIYRITGEVYLPGNVPLAKYTQVNFFSIFNHS